MNIKNPEIDNQLTFFTDKLNGCFTQLNYTLSTNSENILNDALSIIEDIDRIHNAINVLQNIKFSINIEKPKKCKSDNKKKGSSKIQNIPNTFPVRKFSSEEEKALMVGYSDELHD